MPQLDPIMTKIHSKRGLMTKIARACGINRTAVYQWEQVPLERIAVVAEITGIDPEKIRPDFFARLREVHRKRKDAVLQRYLKKCGAYFDAFAMYAARS